MSRFRLGIQVFIRDTREDPQVFMAALVAFVATIFIVVAITGWHFG